MGFETVKLKDLTINLDNKRKPLNELERKSLKKKGLYPYCGANGVLDYIDEFIFDQEILCIAEDGGSWGFREKCAYIMNEPCWVNNHAHVLVAKENVNVKYLCYYLNYADLSKHITGTTRGKLTKSALEKIEVKIPDYSTQNKIVNALDKAQELIDKRKAQIEALDQLTQSVFLEMFGDPLLNPKGWKKESFSYFAKIDTVMIKDFTEYGELIHVGIENIEKDSGRIVNCRTVAEDKIVSGKYLFNEKHIIYSKIRPYLNKVATPNFKGVCSADAYPILVDETKASRHFFAFLLRSKAFLNHVNQHSDRTNIPKVNKNQLLSFEGICPHSHQVKNLGLCTPLKTWYPF